MGESEGRRGAQPGGTIEVSHLTDLSNKQFLLYINRLITVYAVISSVKRVVGLFSLVVWKTVTHIRDRNNRNFFF